MDITAQKRYPQLDKRRATALLKLQRSRFHTVIGVITGHCIKGTHAGYIELGQPTNVFCRSFKDQEEDETVFHLLCTFPALDRRRKRHLGSYNMEDLDELDALIFAV